MTSSPGPERLHPKPPQVMTTQTVSTRRRAPPTGRCRPWLRTAVSAGAGLQPGGGPGGVGVREAHPRTRGCYSGLRRLAGAGHTPLSGAATRSQPPAGGVSSGGRAAGGSLSPEHGRGAEASPAGGGQAPAAPTRLSLQVPLPFGPPRVTPILGAWSPPHQVRGSGGENHSIRLLFQSMGATAFLFCLLEVLLILK